MRDLAIAVALLFTLPLGASAQKLSHSQAEAALRKSCDFFHSLAKHGGYDWRYSKDGKLSEGEGETDAHTIWVQPPGTPAIGGVFLDAYNATLNVRYLRFANESGQALVDGQLRSGGWYYSIHFDPTERAKRGYRDNVEYKPRRRGRDKNNLTTLDDDTTQSVLRFLIRLEQTNTAHRARQTNRKPPERSTYEPAIRFSLDAMIAAQAPNGGWRQNWDRYPTPLSANDFPVREAEYPPQWSREWDNTWTGKYYLNDDVMGQAIRTMLDAWDAFRDERYLRSAKRGGNFLLLAQMPDPQPAWAQQYDQHMHPVWDRKFEPPAISGAESRFAITALLELGQRTGDRKYLEPIPRALAYLKASEIEPARLARFYELRTNKPLYFDRKYRLTYSPDDVPTHYSFAANSGLRQLTRAYKRLERGELPEENSPNIARIRAAASEAITELDDRGGWLDKRGMRGFGKASPEGVYQSETFIRRAKAICAYLSEANAR